MSTQANSKPVRSTTPVIRHAPAVSTGSAVNIFRFLPAAVLSALIHVGLIAGLYVLASPDTQAGVETVKDKQPKDKEEDDNTAKTEDNTPKEDEPPPPVVDDDATPETKVEEKEILNDVAREDKVTVPGTVDLKEPIGVSTGKDDPMTSFSGPSGYGGGTGNTPEGVGQGTGPIGTGGGVVGGSGFKPGGFYGRSGATKKRLLQMDGGTEESEAAVNRGLNWMARHQSPDGHWSLDGFNGAHGCNCRDKGTHNDTAGTAFGILPFLASGYTHKISKDKLNPNLYHTQVAKGLAWLMRHQKRDGDFGGGMYSHGLATIAMCEAYAMTQDPKLKKSAQAAVNFIANAQHPAGGWRYVPRTMAGDISVVGWQVMALKSAQMGNLNVPARTMKMAERYLDSMMSDQTYGYGYTSNNAGELTPTRTSIALLCRQYIQGLGPASPIMSNGVNNYIKKAPPANGKNMYYYYYATQVLHHFGGKNWAEWNPKMRDILIKEQIRKEKEPAHKDEDGSWSPVGDPHAGAGGRVMQTSLSLLTLEVYYRHLPLYRREMVDKKDLAAK